MAAEFLYDMLKNEKALSMSELSNISGKSKDYLLGVIKSNHIYMHFEIPNETGVGKKDSSIEMVTLKGFGTNRCIVCGEGNVSEYDAMRIKIPKGILDIKGLALKRPDHINEGILGHRKCYTSIDVFFRNKEGLTCWDCSSWSGEWIDGDEVLEKCYKWDYKEPGHRGVIGANPICNFFHPNYNMKTNDNYAKERETFNKINFSIALKTKKGLENLMGLLEKARLIEKIN